MAYSELIKNFGKIREYMQEFFVYGFRRRDEFTKKSSRSYDDEKRRIEGWLGNYMGFRTTAGGKSVFLTMDPRDTAKNPLFQAFRSRSFTDGDITLHFLLLDILRDKPHSSVKEICREIDLRLAGFDTPMVFDESTVRKKLKEYAEEGIFTAEKQGKSLTYSLSDSPDLNGYADALAFFSETAPCGVIGSHLLPRNHESPFRLKHHYITHAMDSGVLCRLLEAIGEQRVIQFKTTSRHPPAVYDNEAVPLKIFISVQSGRQHLMTAHPETGKIRSYRVDLISDVVPGEVYEGYGDLRRKLNRMQKSMWGVSVRSSSRLDHLEFVIRADEDEDYIINRLYREKRCGEVEQIDDNHYRFSCDVYDAGEMVPWLRTFICRITAFSCSDRKMEKQFLADIDAMFKLYNIGDGGEDE